MAGPRDEFLRDRKAVTQHQDLVENGFLKQTMDLALFEMLWRQDKDVPMPDACRQNDRLQGAKEYMEIFRTLSEKEVRKVDNDEGALQRE